MFALCVIALFSSLSVSHSAVLCSRMPPRIEAHLIVVGELTCQDLMQPLRQLDLHRLEGRRVLVAGGLRDLADQERFRSRDSAIINFANASGTSEISFKRVFGFKDGCQYLNSNISLDGSSFVISGPNFTATLRFTTCPDCLVAHFHNKSKELQRLYLFSRRRQLEPEEMEEFKAQSECHGMLSPVLMDPTKELCPEEVSKGAEAAERQEA